MGCNAQQPSKEQENEQREAEKAFWDVINKLGTDIDDINQILKGWSK